MPHLVWLYNGSLDKALDAATWLEPTSELRKLGWQVTLITAGAADQHCIRGTEVFSIPRPEKYLLRQIVYHLRFLRFLMGRLNTVDIVMFHPMSAPWLLPVRLLRALAARRAPLMVMDLRSLHMPLRQTQGWNGWLREMFQELVYMSAGYWIDGYLAITQRMADAVHLPPDKLWGTWPSGVDVQHFASARIDRKWPMPDAPIHLVHHGSLHRERNLLTFCKAVARANAEGMSFQLRVLGNGTARAELEDFAARTHAAVRVEPPLPYERIPEALARADIGVLPFPDEEKFRVSSPIKLFEYMAAGLPILATRIACHTDVVGGDQYAFWAEDASEQGLLDALRRIWQSRDLLGQMGAQAAVAAEEWTWAASAGKLKKALEKGFPSRISPVELHRHE